MKIVKIILAIFIAPIAVFLQVGVSTHFWISLVLFCLGWVLSPIHGLWVVLTDQKG